MTDEYALIVGAPAEDDYLHLRRASGLTPKTAEQARPALAGG